MTDKIWTLNRAYLDGLTTLPEYQMALANLIMSANNAEMEEIAFSIDERLLPA